MSSSVHSPPDHVEESLPCPGVASSPQRGLGLNAQMRTSFQYPSALPFRAYSQIHVTGSKKVKLKLHYIDLVTD